MYELTNLLTTITGCSATIIAIVGGFIVSKLITLSIEREEVSKRLFEIDEEINFKAKRIADAKEALDEDDALDYIKENIRSIVLQQSLDEVYKEEERPRLSKEKLNIFWKRAVKISRRLIDIIVNEGEEVNEDGVPNILSTEIDTEFEYLVCKYAVKCFKRMQIEQKGKDSIYLYGISSSLAETIDNFPIKNNYWYQKTRNEMNEINASLEWLKIQQKQLIRRKTILKKPKGMKSGLVVFGVFSLFNVLMPLVFIPFQTEEYCYYLIVKYCKRQNFSTFNIFKSSSKIS